MSSPPGPFAPRPELHRSPVDGATIAVFEVLAAADREEGPAADPAGDHVIDPAARSATARRPPLLLIHGATADHTTWRVVGPRFAASRQVFAMDRRGRGASGDGSSYAIEREFEDVAAVAEALARAAPAGEIAGAGGSAGARVDVAGHSYGGRCALGASLLTSSIRRLVVYEGAPVPPGMTYRPPGLVEAVRAALGRGDNEAALSTFLAGIVGMSNAGLDAYRADPVWPARVAAAHTILREIEAEAAGPASLEALDGVTAPVLLLQGSISRSPFRIGTEALAARLPDARIEVIEGAAHAAHHTHADAFVHLIERFLDA